MKKGELLNKALVLVATEFDGIYDKSGAPYILHCLKVFHYLKTDDEELQIVGLMHDLIEDRGKTVTYARLREMGFTERIIEGVRAMTKVPGETYEEYKNKLKTNPDAIKVKLADLRHNSDIRRLKGITQKDLDRIAAYHELYLELKDLI